MPSPSLASRPIDALPILDLSLLAGGEAGQRQFHAKLLAATHEIGFFYLIGHGIDDAASARAFDVARRFLPCRWPTNCRSRCCAARSFAATPAPAAS